MKNLDSYDFRKKFSKKTFRDKTEADLKVEIRRLKTKLKEAERLIRYLESMQYKKNKRGI